MRTQRRFERSSLLLGEPANRRAAADLGVMLGDHFRAARGNQFRERLARQKGAGEIDDVGIAKQIVEKGLDSGLRIGTAQLKKNDCDSFGPPSQTSPLEATSYICPAAIVRDIPQRADRAWRYP